jgi:hypothetical protein
MRVKTTGRKSAHLSNGSREAECFEVDSAPQLLQVWVEAVEGQPVGEGRNGHDAVSDENGAANQNALKRWNPQAPGRSLFTSEA